MSAATSSLPYFGQFPSQWGTSTTTTDTADRNKETQQHPEIAQDIVFMVAPAGRRGFHYRVSSLWKPLPSGAIVTTNYENTPMETVLHPSMFILEDPLAVESTAQHVALSPDASPSAWRGIFQIHSVRNVLFSQTLELRTETLRRLTPRIHIDRRISEREDA